MTVALCALMAASQRGINPADWYAGGAPGVAYDMTDLGTLFQDRGASSPVTAVGQVAGVVMDLARGPAVLGPQLVTNGDFSNSSTGWAGAFGGTLSASSGVLRVTNSGSLPGRAVQGIATVVGRAYQVTATIIGTAGGSPSVGISNSADGSGAYFVSPPGAGTRNFVFVATAPTTFISLVIGTVTLGATADFDNISVREIPGNPLIAPTDARRAVVGTSNNGLPCLQFGGTRAYATAATLDLTSTDEVVVVAAVRASANADQIIAELSASWLSNAGSFIFSRTGAARFQMGSRGSTGSPTAQTAILAAPDTAVLVARGKINTPEVRIQKNLESFVTSSGTQGTGNYGNHVLNVGARNAASPSLFFNGDISRLAIIGGPISQSTLDQMVAWARAGNSAY